MQQGCILQIFQRYPGTAPGKASYPAIAFPLQGHDIGSTRTVERDLAGKARFHRADLEHDLGHKLIFRNPFQFLAAGDAFL